MQLLQHGSRRGASKERPEVGAVAASLAGDLYGVPVLQKGIQDNMENITRFLVIGRIGDRDQGRAAFSLSSPQRPHRRPPGALEPPVNGMSAFAKSGHAPPQKPWDYYFFIDCIGHFDEPGVKEAFSELEGMCSVVKWLGNYPDVR